MYSIRPFRRASEFPSKRSERVFFYYRLDVQCVCIMSVYGWVWV